MAKQTNGKARVKSVYMDDDANVLDIQNDPTGVVKAYRAAVLEEHDVDLENVDATQIIQTLLAVPGREDDEDEGEQVRTDRLQALADLVDTDTGVDVSAVASPLGALAIDLAAKMSAEVDKVLEEAADAKEKTIGAPLSLIYPLNKLFGGSVDKESGYITRCPAVLDLPVPFSSYKSDYWGNRNSPLDIYQFKDRETGQKITGRFYRDFADSIKPHGPSLLSDIRDLKRLKDSKEGIANKEFVKLYGNADQKSARESKLSQLNQRRTSRMNAVARAIGYLQVATRLRDEFYAKGVRHSFTVDDGPEHMDEVVTRNKPIEFAQIKGDTAKSTDPYSLSQFLSLQHPKKDGDICRLDLAAKKGSNVAAITDTLKKEPKAPEPGNKQGGNQDKTGKDIGIPTPEELVAWCSMFASGLDESGDKTKATQYRAKLMSHFNKVTDDVNDELTALYNANIYLTDLLKPYEKRILDTMSKQAELGSESGSKKTKAA
jgi:hypothetical protein